MYINRTSTRKERARSQGKTVQHITVQVNPIKHKFSLGELGRNFGIFEEKGHPRQSHWI